jgi:type IV secretory pathway TrbD component
MKSLSIKNVVSIVMLIGATVCIVGLVTKVALTLGIGLAIFIVALVIFAVIEP